MYVWIKIYIYILYIYIITQTRNNLTNNKAIDGYKVTYTK